jgi:hypothetical protein
LRYFFGDRIKGIPREGFLDVSELKLVAEMHADFLATPPEKLVLAFDFIKTTVLLGNPYRTDDFSKVSLELKKYLSSSSNEIQKSLAMEVERQNSEVKQLRRSLDDER